MIVMRFCTILVILLSLACAFGAISYPLKDERDFLRSNDKTNSIHYNRRPIIYPSDRKLTGTCVTSFNDKPADCVKCLNATNIYYNGSWVPSMGWCANPKFCFDASDPNNVLACTDNCNGDITYSDDANIAQQCSFDGSVTNIVLIFILVVGCPVFMMVVCLALLCYRCRNALTSKVYIGTDYRDTSLISTIRPVPILQVHSNSGGRLAPAYYSFPMTTAEVAIPDHCVNLDDVNGYTNKSGPIHGSASMELVSNNRFDGTYAVAEADNKEDV